MNVYLARGSAIPKRGKPLMDGFLQRLKKNGQWEYLSHTSKVTFQFSIGNDIYVIRTKKGTIYIYQYIDWEEMCKPYQNSKG